MGVSIPLVAGATGIASGISNLFGGNRSSTNVGSPANNSMFNNPALTGTIQQFGGMVGSAPQYNTWAQTIPQYQDLANQAFSNPYNGQAQNGANNAGAAQQQFGGQLLQQGQNNLPFATQALNNGFDPQNALYNRLFQQNTDQTRAAQGARGIGMSPYGAGLENQSDQTFNLGWQNAQLGRQATAANTAQTLNNGAASLGGAGINNMVQGSMLPLSTQQAIAQGQGQALNNLGTAGQNTNAQTNTTLQQLIAFLGQANGGQQTGNQAAQDSFNNQQTVGTGLGNSLSSFGSAYGRSGLPGGSSLFGGGSSGGGVASTMNVGGQSYPMYT